MRIASNNDMPQVQYTFNFGSTRVNVMSHDSSLFLTKTLLYPIPKPIQLTPLVCSRVWKIFTISISDQRLQYLTLYTSSLKRKNTGGESFSQTETDFYNTKPDLPDQQIILPKASVMFCKYTSFSSCCCMDKTLLF